MIEIVKGFCIVWENDDHEIVDAEVNIAVSRATGVWLVAAGTYESNEAFRMIVGHRDETDVARAYAAHRKALNFDATPVYRLFPLLSTEPIAETQLGDNYEETWAAFSDTWIEVRL